ncbi:MAG: metal-sensing transcriptional repressor [Lachnospiraceae bacterium]|nr:metal-sensing transcriptional repressor [Lachnospiraceae bacterium]
MGNTDKLADKARSQVAATDVEKNPAHFHRTDEQKKFLMNRLKRLEGQIRGLEKMIDNDASCNEVLQQSVSAGSALDGFQQEVLSYHVKGCITSGVYDDNADEIDELLKLIRKLMK